MEAFSYSEFITLYFLDMSQYIEVLCAWLRRHPRIFLTSSLLRPSIDLGVNPNLLAKNLAASLSVLDSEIIFSSASPHLVGSVAPYDKCSTPVTGRGVLNAELLNYSCFRSSHPFCSFAGLNTNLTHMNSYNLSRHAYGLHTPAQYMVDSDFIGVHINTSLGHNVLVHHSEHLAAVPYRYTKRFSYSYIDEAGESQRDDCFMNVLYRQEIFDRDLNKRLLSAMGCLGFKTFSTTIGNVWQVTTYSVADYVRYSLLAMVQDPLIWLPQAYSKSTSPKPFDV